MHAATNMYFNAPPPTFNTLDTRQRTRLIRSTRKLGAVLGTTPQLVESECPISPEKTPTFSPRRDRKRRQGSIFEFPPSAGPFRYNYDSPSASSSASSLALPRTSIDSDASDASTHSLPALPMPKSFARHVREKSRGKGKHTALPTPLVLRLNAVPLPPSDPRIQPTTPDTAATLKTATLTASTSTPTPSYPYLPLTPTTPHTPGTPTTPTVTETRRKRLAKLKRTLGENVPPELIMPFRSARTPSSQRPSPVDPPPAPQTLSPPALSALHPALHPYSHHQEHARSRPPPVKAQRTVPFVRPAKEQQQRRRSVSVDFKHGVMSPALFAPAPAPKEGALGHSRSPSAFRMTSPRRAAREREREREQSVEERVWVTNNNGTWTGEWNRKDIREVQQQLRNLKLR
ncbi:hypothetical protein L226DRAFT_455542 [Lentinus tigrinus ALCF2SS1-7]|uniref:Uncharacterized protein n=1 Tax=Lentinus tigrinus ALCF2SS1-6 TaxID=1328759 RepID=A0A5C2RQ73_9APHY|nr:hypothetical protein L227DRAFT_512816 [Lentinus tigrinus ALCF2SS1-6]RPD79656.1 hypothetical protein L226DRAFT_455542 [Lentinus tigrinus ALCF2SS1-7]